MKTSRIGDETVFADTDLRVQFAHANCVEIDADNRL